MIQCPFCHQRFALHTAPLTKTQVATLRFISDFQKEHGVAPTLREIADAFFLKALSSVHERLQHLERKGRIAVEYNSERGITVLDSNDTPT